MERKHRYLIVDADYRTTGLRDEFEGMLKPKNIDIPQRVWADLARWVRRYGPFALIAEEDLGKPDVQATISALDAEGMVLAGRIQKELGDYFKVRYYSAARNEYLSSPDEGKAK